MKPRRFVSVFLTIAVSALVTLLLPVLVVIAALASLLPGFGGALRTLGFVTGYLYCQLIGLISALWIWSTIARDQRYIDANHKLKHWWAQSLKNLAEFFYSLTFTEHNTAALQGNSAIMLPRHASIADTIIPVVFYSIPANVRLRYVLKKELLWDPCLDIVGNRLPNHFVDRSGEDSDAARAGVTNLLQDLGDNEGLMIFVEGTRSTPERRSQLRAKAQNNADLLSQVDRWPDLLPPRLGGVSSVLAANPGRDILFCAHHGFEGSSHFRNLLNGSWCNAKINVEYWRVPFAEIPTSSDQHRDFLFTQWDRMQATINKYKEVS